MKDTISEGKSFAGKLSPTRRQVSQSLLIALLLFETKVLSQPLLYLSLYLKEHRAEYYRLLDAVRREGDWEEWIDFFLEGVTMTAQSAVDTAHRMLRVFEEDAARVADLGRRAPNALRAWAPRSLSLFVSTPPGAVLPHHLLASRSSSR